MAEHLEGRLVRATWEALAASQKLAEDLHGSVIAVVLGRSAAEVVAEISAAKVQEVLAVESDLLGEYTADGYTQALLKVIEGRRAGYIVFGHTYQARDFAPKLAAALGRGLISDCLSYREEGGKLVFTRQVFQGKFNTDVLPLGEPPYLVSFQAGAFREDAVQRASTPPRATKLPVHLPPGAVRTKPGERFQETRQSVDLAQAEIIVAAGRGIKAPENLTLAQKLAEALGGEVGASRPICDNGWLPMDRQIGSSGQTVSPKLYIALGISGAIQHQVGMKGSRTIVAINKDHEAPIFEIASYGVVGDLFEIVPPLIEEINKAKTS